MNNSRGISLVEFLSAVTVIGILGVSLGFAYSGWITRYAVEKQTKQIYSDLMAARIMALERNRTYFADFNGSTTYRIIEDTDNNSAINVGTGDTVLIPKAVEYVTNANGSGIPLTITFNHRGLISPLRTLWITHTTDPDYDCVVISSTRINMGRMAGSSCVHK